MSNLGGKKKGKAIKFMALYLKEMLNLRPIVSLSSYFPAPTAMFLCNQTPHSHGTRPSVLLHVQSPLHLTKPVTFQIFINSAMDFFFFLLLPISSILFSPHWINAQPSPGYYPSFILRPVNFYQGFTNRWGPQHQWVSRDQSSLTIWLDKNSGSGFKSIQAFQNGYFAASIMLQRGYTAGVITAFYLSNNEAHPGFHDEVDMEFLGTKPGEPYTLQTNVYVRGSGDGRIIGREMKFHLWFDPTAAFHNYAILWNHREIIFLVDDVPIRRYANRSPETFPLRPMWVYGSIWDASSWATDDGRYRADYRFEPFVAHFTHFVARGCTVTWQPRCRPPASSPSGFGLSWTQHAAMIWAQQRSLVYDYCRDPKRDHSLTPECR